MSQYNLLGSLKLPEDLKKLDLEQQKALCRELRQRLIQTVSQNGGHLASNLGIVELTVALHTVFAMPKDQIVWDVGHQCYTHKMLTGRLDSFSTVRKEGGISGFPRSTESRYDSFIGGHASTSISAVCGLAKAKTLLKDPHHVVAVIGDGAFTGGMVYEGLNNAGRSGDRIIIVLNDNNMSISKNVGSLARYLANKRATDGYLYLKDRVEETLDHIPLLGESVSNVLKSSKTLLRQALLHSNMFEDFGFDYLGPVDGHNLPLLVQVLNRAKELNKPVVVHVNTVKGKGYAFAEKNPAQFHGVGSFDCASGKMKSPSENFSSVFGNRLVELARKDSKICAITAAMQSGTGLQPFANEFSSKGRFFDVGIAEEHAVTFACGLAAGGMTPIFAVYSTFLQRGYDQLIHDASIEPRHVVLAVDRAGIVGDDGETHQGLFDAAFLSQLPGSAVYSPATYQDLYYALDRALYAEKGLAAVRYPRGAQIRIADWLNYSTGDYFHYKNGGNILIVTYGREFAQAQAAVKLLQEQGKKADLLKLNRIWPIPPECIGLAKRYRSILFVEEGVEHGGIGEHFLAALAERQYRGNMTFHGIQHPFVPQMEYERALEYCRLDAQSLANQIIARYF